MTHGKLHTRPACMDNNRKQPTKTEKTEDDEMELVIFAKNRTSRDGKPFTAYVTKLTRKDGTTMSVSVKFREECGAPKKEMCPMNIVVDRDKMNLSDHTYMDAEGVLKTGYTLWVSEWNKGAEYVDHSLDDFI